MRRRTFVGIMAALPVLGACQNPDGQPATGDGGIELRLAEGTEPDSLSPIAALYGLSTKVHEGLYRITGDGEVTPAIADAPAAPDGAGTLWTVPVGAGHRFSSGDEVTVDDVAATYRAILDPDTGSALATQFAMLDRITTTAHGVEFQLHEPYAAFDRLLTVGIGPADLVGQPVESSTLATDPVGSGPYRVAQWRAGESLIFEPNPHFTPKPALDRIVINFVADQNAVLQRAASGDFDGAQLAPVLARTFENKKDWTVWANPSADFRAVTFPRNHPAFTDSRVRQALNYAVNRQQMVDGILYGYGQPAHTPVSQAQGDLFNPDAVYAHDTSKAEQLLTAAGWRPGSDGVRRKDGTELEFTVMYFAEDVLRRDLTVAFAADMKKIGVRVEVEAVSRPEARRRIPTAGLLVGGGDMPYHPDQHLAPLLDGASAEFDADQPFRNPSGYRNDQIDDLLEQGRASLDPQDRTRIYRSIQTEYLADPALVTLTHLRHTYIARGTDQWAGLTPVLEPHEHGVAWGPWWNVEAWAPR